MTNQTSILRHRMIRTVWIAIAVTSVFLQLMLIVCGGLYLSELHDWKFIRIVALIAGFWSLVWPIYAYVGMNHSYREMLEDRRLRIKDAQNKSAHTTAGSAPV